MSMPKYCDTPEKVEAWKVRQRAYQKAYQQTPKGKACIKDYQQTPKGKACIKAYLKAYRQTPEHKAASKACKKAYRETLRAEQSTADVFRMMQAASELAKALTNLSEPTPQNK
jgi:hypothetical protein